MQENEGSASFTTKMKEVIIGLISVLTEVITSPVISLSIGYKRDLLDDLTGSELTVKRTRPYMESDNNHLKFQPKFL